MNRIAERVRALPPGERRRFLLGLGALLASPFVPAALRYAGHELALGEAHAQQMEQSTLFLEFDFRDQVDLMHVMVPPSIAKYPRRSVGVNGQELSMFAAQAELKAYPNNVFLTNDSLELAPHIDSIAMLDTGEAGIGSIHGHEAANGMRSPGRVMDGGVSGLAPLWLLDGEHQGGSEELYGAVPTPASFHNYQQKKLFAQVQNGFAFKGISRPKHSVYHFGAGLPGAELTRVPSKENLFELYGSGFFPGLEATRLLEDIRDHVGLPYRKPSGAGNDGLNQRFHELQASTTGGLELTAAEVAHWSQGVPTQQCSNDVVHFDCEDDPLNPGANGDYVKAQIWEQFGYASKLFRSGQVRSIALEFDYMDLSGDGVRTEEVVRTQAQQVARPLARLIASLKSAGLYDHTVIAVYTLDGSRTPAANSYGDSGKGTLLLAGGRVRGGYYGDISITADLPQGGHSYALHPPDLITGLPMPAVDNWGDPTQRTPSGAVWRTVMKALGIPEAEYVGQFHAQIDSAAALDFMLKS